MNNLALKQYTKYDFSTDSEQQRTVTVQWFKILGAVVFAAWLMTVIAVASVWLKLEIEQKYQRIDSIKIRNTALKQEIQKLEAELMELKSLEKIEQNVSEAGVSMVRPTEMFFVDPSRGSGQMALGAEHSDANGPI